MSRNEINEIVQLLSKVAKGFEEHIQFIHYVWVGPLQLAISIYFTYVAVGISTLAGLFLIIICLNPLQGKYIYVKT